MNRLEGEESPYLQQHKNNPVDWYPWGKEAFQKAKEEDKPILVSIGYSTCHWCHVMEKESFEDEETATLMNKHFVNIKVDREENPAVDQYYMEAIQILTGSGGWPLNCFLTPGRKPYFGGTYFPPDDRHGRPSWENVLMRMSSAFRERRDEVDEQAEKLSKLVLEGNKRFVNQNIELPETPSFDIDSWVDKIEEELDIEKGGLQSAPKFPSPQLYQFLLQYAIVNDVENLDKAVERTAHAFIDGGLFDPVHGGFSRYCVDENWRVPHFEKMLYDNAGILSFLAQMQAFKPHDRYKWAIRKTLRFWENEMKGENGLFLSAVDADSEGEEGKYYTWKREELKEVLSAEEFSMLDVYCDIRPDGNWEGSNILHTDPQQRAKFFEEFTEEQLDQIFDKLRKNAQNRIKPGIDDKQLLDWNAMMVTALIHVDRYTGNERSGEMAINNMETLLDIFVEDGKVKGHAYKNGKVYAEATLDDYAYLIAALIEAYEWYFDESYIRKAKELCQTAAQEFETEDSVLWMVTSADSTNVVGRQPNYFDNAYPSGNSVMAHNLRKLGIIFENREWKDKAELMMASIEESVAKYPTAFNNWAALGFAIQELNAEVAIIGEKYKEWGRKLAGETFSEVSLMASRGRNEEFPLLDMEVEEGKTGIYLCQNYTCQQPVYSLKDFSNLRSDILHH